MNSLAITYEKLEKYSAQEIEELIKTKTKIKSSVVLFNANEKQLNKLCYTSQSCFRILKLLKQGNIKDFNFEDIDFSFLENKTFKVNCERIGNHNFSSIDKSYELGSYITKKYNLKSDMKTPDVIIYIYIFNDNFYIGIDLFDFDLSKREYKIFNHPTSLKGPLAFLMLKASGFLGKGTLLDPYCTSGVIPIEAALYSSKFPVRYFQKKNLFFEDKFYEEIDSKIIKSKEKNIFAFDSLQRNIKAAEKNAKIAGIKDKIDFSVQSIDYIDLKFEDKKVDFIVTQIPHMSKHRNRSIVNKKYREFFYQLKLILKKTAVLLARPRDKIDEFKEFKEDFKLKEKIEFTIGESEFVIFVIGVNSSFIKNNDS